MYYNSIILKGNETIKEMFVDGSRYAVLVYNHIENSYYAIINGNRSKSYKTFGHCKNLILKNNYHGYLSENDVMNIRKKVFVQ